MKKLLPLLSLICLASCGGKDGSEKTESDNLLENLTYSVDTLVLDPGKELINLRYGLRWFDLSSDKQSLFLYDPDRNLFQEIDLENMTLKENYQYEKDGPNGTGRVNSFQLLSDKTIFIPSYQNPGIFNLQGEQTRSFNLKPNDLEGAGSMSGFAILNQMLWSPKSEKHYSLPGDITTGKFEFAITNPKSQSVQVLNLVEMEKSRNFRVTQIEGDGGAAFTEVYNLTSFKDDFIITCSIGSGVYFYDTSIDSLLYLNFSHKLIPTEKSGEIKNDVSSSNEWWQEYKKVVSQISYWGLHWDESTSRFYRLASRSILGETRKDPASYEVFLLVYDKELNLLGESQIKGYDQFPQSYFFKDGKLWSYVNVDDELGFAVFTFDF
ncbi:DUF4221 domain-containing protein [Algoriphagus machipongonensis]|uniref:DUF4221 domain-containing protein n=1 Tax=Algoriphagus machipongonensis TaxID=388413 RepID=A3HUB8_9BACT|nr:DUF4221 domain-containing protein [Algoriphagus machipongonensis]EAZ81740.1 hypothetical protein ALPR1_00825 [Algoriphagus machipongonensis]